jgi:hypothetical protein
LGFAPIADLPPYPAVGDVSRPCSGLVHRCNGDGGSLRRWSEMAQPDHSSLPPPPGSSHLGRRRRSALVVVAWAGLALLLSISIVVFVLARNSVGSAACPASVVSASAAQSTLGVAGSAPADAMDLARRLERALPSSLDLPGYESWWTWDANSVRHNFLTGSGGEVTGGGPFLPPQLSPGLSSVVVTVGVYDSPEARRGSELAVKDDLAAELKRTSMVRWLCFADCGPASVSFETDARPLQEFNDADRNMMRRFVTTAQSELNAIYGNCPAPEVVVTNKGLGD